MDPACQVGTVQGYGSSIAVWGVSSWHCLGSAMRVPTSFNAIRYVELLGYHLHSFMLFCYPHGMEGHPPAPTKLTELWTALANIWEVIPVERFQKLVESMPRRVAAVIKRAAPVHPLDAWGPDKLGLTRFSGNKFRFTVAKGTRRSSALRARNELKPAQLGRKEKHEKY
ncbi:transposable element Tcb2 transposase [Trichonephila clavipes]|nr:transposable element Tcb2 transposase [Trichonephila clavipes]